MNAPWKPGPNGGRDPFAAFMCDEASLEVLRPVIEELGWQPEKCTKGGLRTAVHSLSVSASPNVLMVDLSESVDPLNDIHGLAEVCEPGTIVLAVGQVNDVRLYRDLVASGIHDYLLKPLSAATVRDALIQAQTTFAAPKISEQDGGRKHLSTAVIGLRGGVGASTLATSLAWLFSTEQKAATALLDLDIHFGTGALTLDLEPGRGLTDAIENPSRIDGLFLERAMIRANEKLSLLSAEAPLHTPLLNDGGAFLRLETEFQDAFEMTVIDLPRHMLVNYPQLATNLNVVVLVAELTLASARDAIRLLSWFKSHVPSAQVIVVANKVPAHPTEISASDFETSIERKIDLSILFDTKGAGHASKLGQTFAETNKNTKVGLALRDLAQLVIGTTAGDKSQPATKTGLLGKFDLKAWLAKKEKPAPAKASH